MKRAGIIAMGMCICCASRFERQRGQAVVLTAEGQGEGAVVQGIGLAMMEEMVIDEEGRVTNPNFGEYNVPPRADLPAFKLTWIEDSLGPLPFGGRALAEHGHIPISPAVANAIRDVAGIRLKHIPFRPETVDEALQARERS